MKLLVIYLSVLVASLGLTAFTSKVIPAKPCWCWPHNWRFWVSSQPQAEGAEFASPAFYDSEVDWNSTERTIVLDYAQAQGKRVFYQHCVWCHADSTPAGPSNRSNVTPDPPLMNDGKTLNGKSDAELEKAIALGGSAVGKSAMMPPYGMTLTHAEIGDVIAYTRAIATPEYHRPLDKGSWFMRRER